MNLRAMDLNLLVIFDALMTEQNVTRAANRIPMSQPAMSNALMRLRHLFKDELFVRAAGGMAPTPRAEELGEAVRQILRRTERLMSTEITFDPMHAERRFTARMSDLVGFLVLPPVLSELRTHAPGVTLDVLHMSPDRTLKALEADQLDFGLSMELRHSDSIRSEALFDDQMVCVMRSDHPLAQGELSMDQFLQAEHLRVAMSPTDIRFVDNVLADQGLARKVVANVPHWLLIPEILRETDLIAVISSKLAARFTAGALTVKPLPFFSAPFSWTIYWHRRNDNSIPQKWLRELIRTCCAGL